MASFNKVLLLGNLTRDPETRFLPSGSAICQLGLAMNRKYADGKGEAQEEVTFVDVEVFGRQAENCQQYLRRGAPVLVEGRLRLDSWDDRESGKKRSRLLVVGERVQFLGGRDDAPTERDTSPAPPPRRDSQRRAEPPPRRSRGDDADVPPGDAERDEIDETIPF